METEADYGVAARDASPIEQALRRANEGEAIIGKLLHELEERIGAYLRPEDGNVPSSGLSTLQPAPMQRGQFYMQLDSHADALEAKASRIRSILGRLDA